VEDSLNLMLRLFTRTITEATRELMRGSQRTFRKERATITKACKKYRKLIQIAAHRQLFKSPQRLTSEPHLQWFSQVTYKHFKTGQMRTPRLCAQCGSKNNPWSLGAQRGIAVGLMHETKSTKPSSFMSVVAIIFRMHFMTSFKEACRITTAQ
jgi:hypothetical protein